MIKKLGIISSLLLASLIISCEDNKSDKLATLTFDLGLPIDKNGYHLLTLDRENWQTLHRVSGVVEANDVPVENFWVTWTSDLFWYVGDTLGYLVDRRYSLYIGQYVYGDTSFMIGFSGMEVPTTNMTSLSNASGEINNVIAPVKSMVGDTMYLSAEWFDGYTTWGIILK